jgi:hypothetical protein
MVDVTSRRSRDSALHGADHGHAGRWVTVGIEVLVAVMALYGGIFMIWDNKLGMLDEWLEGTPFTSWTVPGLLLIAVVAVPMLTAAALEARRHRWAPQASIVAGTAQIGWIGAQLVIMQRYNFQQPIILGAGLAIVIVTLWVYRDVALGEPLASRDQR